MAASSPESGALMPQRILDIALCFWFIVIGVAFFAPYLGVALPDLTAVYGAFLLLSMAALALRLLRGGGSGGDEEGTQEQGSAPQVVPIQRNAVKSSPPARERKKRRG